MTKWVTVSQAAGILGMSERTVRRHIAEGKIQSTLEDGRRLVEVEVNDSVNVTTQMTPSDKDALIEWLKNELETRSRQVDQLHDELRNWRERSDAVMVRLMEELEAQRKRPEDGAGKRKRDSSFLRGFGRKD